MPKRKSISKKIRFEVFKRDSFTCQYCGKKSPDVILHVDHINPVSKGGGNEIINLLTSCLECNQGKSDRLINDRASIDKQRAQIEELSKRREQLEMMLKWRDELAKFDSDVVSIIVESIQSLMCGSTINDHGKSSIKKWLKKYTVEEILDAAQIAEQKEVSDSELFSLIPKICQTKRLPEDDQKIRYARGILRNRLNYINENMALNLMKAAAGVGADGDILISIAKQVPSWAAFKAEMESILNG